MTDRPISLAFGKDPLDLTVPEEFLAGEVIRPRALPSMTPQQILERMRDALAHPVGRPPLRELAHGRTVCVLPESL